jgi:hypothetical protein
MKYLVKAFSPYPSYPSVSMGVNDQASGDVELFYGGAEFLTSMNWGIDALPRSSPRIDA